MPLPADEIRLIELFALTKVIGLTINHENMSEAEVEAAIIAYEIELGIPVTDALTRPCRTPGGHGRHGLSRARGGVDCRSAMRAPRLEIDLGKIFSNAQRLVGRLAEHGVSVTGVAKAALGMPALAETLVRAGVASLGDSRVDNIVRMRRAGVATPVSLIRSPLLSQPASVAKFADVSFNTELHVLRRLSNAAQAAGTVHGVVLMVELGDLREGILPEDLEHVVQETLALPSLLLKGLGSNLACRSGVAPDAKNMGELSEMADRIEATFGVTLATVSGGNSTNLRWALSGAGTGRINDLRLGEGILLGRDPLDRHPIEGLHLDAFTLVGEVIES